jgi:hypothetical protein
MSTDLVDLAQDKEKWRVIVNEEIKLRVPKDAGNFLLAKNLLKFQEGLCSIE